MHHPFLPRRVMFAAAAAVFLLAAGIVAAQLAPPAPARPAAGAPSAAPADPATAPAAVAPASTAPVLEPRAAEVLRKVSDYYKTMNTASTSIDTTMKFTGAGRDEAMTSNTALSVERPNKLSVVVKEQKTGGGTAISDGKNLSLLIPQLNRYATEPAPPAMDQLIDSPVAMVAQHANIVLILFSSDPYAKITQGLNRMSYVGQEEIDGKKYDRLRMEQQEIDFDVWTAAGEQPLIRRIRPDLTRQIQQAAAQMPQLKGAKMEATVEVKDWSVNQPAAADKFAFAAPQTATKANTFMEIFRPAGGMGAAGGADHQHHPGDGHDHGPAPTPPAQTQPTTGGTGGTGAPTTPAPATPAK